MCACGEGVGARVGVCVYLSVILGLFYALLCSHCVQMCVYVHCLYICGWARVHVLSDVLILIFTCRSSICIPVHLQLDAHIPIPDRRAAAPPASPPPGTAANLNYPVAGRRCSADPILIIHAADNGRSDPTRSLLCVGSVDW